MPKFQVLLISCFSILLSSCAFLQNTHPGLQPEDLAQAEHLFKKALKSKIQKEGGSPQEINIHKVSIHPKHKNHVLIDYKVVYELPATSESSTSEISYSAISTIESKIAPRGKPRNWNVVDIDQKLYKVRFVEGSKVISSNSQN